MLGIKQECSELLLQCEYKNDQGWGSTIHTIPKSKGGKENSQGTITTCLLIYSFILSFIRKRLNYYYHSFNITHSFTYQTNSFIHLLTCFTLLTYSGLSRDSGETPRERN
jgi:hypothetical protein